MGVLEGASPSFSLLKLIVCIAQSRKRGRFDPAFDAGAGARGAVAPNKPVEGEYEDKESVVLVCGATPIDGDLLDHSKHRLRKNPFF